MKSVTHPRILVIEDDEPTRWVLGQSLQHLSVKVEVLSAGSASEGIEALEKNRIDLVVCDFHLGDSTGIDVLKYLRDQKSEIPFVLYTAEVLSNIPHVSYRKFAHVQKPELNGLLEAIEKQIGV